MSAIPTSLDGLPSTSPAGLLDSLQDALTSRLDFTRFFSQATRLIQLDTALPGAALVVEKFHGREAINEPFRFELDCISTSAHLELKTLIGEQLTLRLQKADGGWRAWHGYVVQAAQLGSDGGAARYRLTLASWLHFLQLRQDSFVFQDRTALQVVEAVFADHAALHGQAAWRVDVSPEVVSALRVREICTQYQESDFDFVSRLLAEESLSYHFEHEDAAEARGLPSDEQARHARHCLVITDATSARPDLGALRLGRPAPDTLTQFSATRRVRPSAVTIAAWRPTQLVSATGQAEASLTEALPPLEVYRARSEGDANLSDRHTSAQAASHLNALRLDASTFSGEGAVRTLAAGSTFDLADARYTLLAVEHHAANNLGSQAARLLDHADTEPGTYQQRFEAVAADTPIAPRPPRKPIAPPQLAEVVGLPGDALTTDRDLRVKVQFAWQRGAQPLAGGLTDTGTRDDAGNAPGDHRSGTWLRVAQPCAGANWGSALLPRSGAEVLVDFVDGDIDQPLIVGQLPTPSEPLPWAAGAHTDTNHPGTISGLRSTSLVASASGLRGGNEWLIDDTPGQLRMRLRSWGGGDSAHGELTLGHVVQQADSAQRGALLGQGFYAHTEGWTMLRAGQGLLLTTAARAQRGTSVESTQMDAAEALAALRSARTLGQSLSDAAAAQGALPLSSHADRQALHAVADGLDPAQRGKLPSRLNGQAARQAQADSRTLADPVPAFAEPHVVLDAAASLAWATPGPVSAYSGQHTSLVATADAHVAAAHTTSLAAGGTVSLYAHDGGAQAIAAAGPLSVRAHTGTQSLLAEQGITLTSSASEIHLQAAQRITIMAGQSQVELNGTDITFTCPGTFTMKAASHDWEGGGGAGAELPLLPLQRASIDATPNAHDQFFVLRWANSGRPMKGQRFRLRRADGSVQTGTTDDRGRSPVLDTASQAELLTVEVLRQTISS
jgi:type VI secretion system secreted protein VgrG